MVEVKAQIEEETAAAMKKLTAEKWGKISDLLKAGGAEYTGPAVERKFELMLKKGEVDNAGNYIVKNNEAGEAAPASGSGGGSAEEEADAEAQVEAEVENDDEADAEGENDPTEA